jgi:hypothetical protein
MRFPKFLKGNASRKEQKRRARELAMKGWGLGAEALEPQGMDQLRISRGIGHHMARSFKGHV